MFFKMSNALLYNEVMRKLTSAIKKGDCSTKIRGFVFICMMADGADNFRPYHSADDIARLYDVGKNQAKIVWEILSELNVLRKDEDGYSCIEWMKENYIFGSAQTAGSAQPAKKASTQTIDENAPASRETLLKVIRGEL